MADVFLSYKRENKETVQAVVVALRGAGLSVWWDQDIPPDAPWEASIERELQQAKVVIVAWSQAAVASENVKAEARRARAQGKLVQIFVEPCEPPLFFGERQGVDLTNWSGDAADPRFAAVLAAARALRDGTSPPQGVGYAQPKRGLDARAAILAAVVVLGLGGAAAYFGFSGVAPTPESATSDPVVPTMATQTPTAPTPSPQAAAPPAVAIGVRHDLEIQSGYAVDFESGTASASLTDASDFVVSGAAGGFTIASVAPPAAVGLASNGAPTPASCAIEPASPTMTWSIPMPNDVGEYQCFTTREGRSGALLLRPGSGATTVKIDFELWP
ncbi:MAG: toll/interleukin-1 receptor domain-containing protein [Hyphomonadaceae bacterium]|nr:toll/interleukin-1 receptor domain-containing protein [Hyphomonadaceae bacterium]